MLSQAVRRYISNYFALLVLGMDTQQSQFVHHYFLFKFGVLILGWLHLYIGLFLGLFFTIVTVTLKPEMLDDMGFVKISEDKVHTHI